jgi:hypothetical protein
MSLRKKTREVTGDQEKGRIKELIIKLWTISIFLLFYLYLCFAVAAVLFFVTPAIFLNLNSSNRILAPILPGV